MLAARVHGPRDLRVERVPRPPGPGPAEVLLKVRVTGICGSDLHSYLDGRIGDTPIASPLILGHEFCGVVQAAGPESADGFGQVLRVGQRVAVDPAQPCGTCEMCETGHPNLCPEVAFCGCHPYGGSLCEYISMPARCCFSVPDSLSDDSAALLEPLGVALHAVDLAHLRVGYRVVVLGAGPIGLLIAQLALRAGAQTVIAVDRLQWRLKLARRMGAATVEVAGPDTLGRVGQLLGARGADVVFEAAWADESVAWSAELARFGGRVVLVGIPSDDRLLLKHSTARRKGLTLVLSRRMKHVYPRCLQLAIQGAIDLDQLVTHRFPLPQTDKAFALNSAYQDSVVKVMVSS
jgi:L-iditol 2-dehydrogenase